MHAVVKNAVASLLRDNADVKRAYQAMRYSGATVKHTKEEIARALLGCMWEASRGLPDRWTEVLSGLSKGQTTEQLFPDALYEETDSDNGGGSTS